MISICLVDDNNLFRDSIRTFLHSTGQFKVLASFDRGKKLLYWLEENALPDMILIDYKLPDIYGNELIRLIREKYTLVKLCILSALDHNHILDQVIRAGANGYFSKMSDTEPFIEGLTAALEGNLVILRDGINLAIYESVDKRLTVSENIRLTERQKVFLKYTVRGDLSYKMIADKLGISPKTADRYRDELFKKLGVTSRTGLALYAIQNGLV